MAVTTYGKPTTIPTLLTAINARIVEFTGLSADQVYEAFDDEKLDQYPDADEFVQIAPRTGQFEQAVLAGSDLLVADLQIAVNFWKRQGLDVAYQNAIELRDETNGILETFRVILKALLLFSPVDDAGATQAIVTEPARPIGFEMRPRRHSNGWSCVRSVHLFSCNLDLT